MDDDRLARVLAALGSPNRLLLFRRLVEAGQVGLGPTALAEAADLQRNLVSYHLQPLVAAGLVRNEKRGRDVMYSVDTAAFAHFTRAVQVLVMLRR